MTVSLAIGFMPSIAALLEVSTADVMALLKALWDLLHFH